MNYEITIIVLNVIMIKHDVKSQCNRNVHKKKPVDKSNHTIYSYINL